MVRVYKSVRLAYEAKVWIDELIQKKERKIKELNQDNFLNTLEQTLLSKITPLLNGRICVKKWKKISKLSIPV